MLLRHVVFLTNVPLQSRKDLPPVQQRLPGQPLELHQALVRGPVRIRLGRPPFRRNHEVLELFAEDDDPLFLEERVVVEIVDGTVVDGGVRGGVAEEGVLGLEEARGGGCAVEV